jgi:hypothetical protein
MGKMLDEDESKAMAKVKAEKAEAAEAEPTKRTKTAAPKDVGEILDDWAE